MRKHVVHSIGRLFIRLAARYDFKRAKQMFGHLEVLLCTRAFKCHLDVVMQRRSDGACALVGARPDGREKGREDRWLIIAVSSRFAGDRAPSAEALVDGTRLARDT